jgi:hypothetical protein
VSISGVFADRELVELLAEKPDLLAIADAIRSTGPKPHRRRVPVRVPLLAAAVLCAALVALLSPWSESRGGVLAKALAAVSTDEVLHTVVVQSVPGEETVDLRTGRSVPDTIRIEGWFDFQRSLKRTVTIRDGVRDDVLATPQGVFSSAGVVPTCSWIAAQPVEATKLRVSCNPSGKNGTTPRHVPESIPAPDPALAGFITGYRQALRTGRATNLGAGEVDGHHVFWIGFKVDANQRERVAVDSSTYRPLVHDTVLLGHVVIRARVVTAEKLSYTPSAFARPKLSSDRPPVIGNVVRTTHLSLAAAERALAGRAASLGSQFAGLALTDARLDSLRTGYGVLSNKPIAKSVGVEFVYGKGSQRGGTGPYLRLSEALSPQMAYWGQATQHVAPGMLSLTTFASSQVERGKPNQGRPFWVGQLHTGRLWVTVEGSDRLSVIRAAQTLAGHR